MSRKPAKPTRKAGPAKAAAAESADRAPLPVGKAGKRASKAVPKTAPKASKHKEKAEASESARAVATAASAKAATAKAVRGKKAAEPKAAPAPSPVKGRGKKAAEPEPSALDREAPLEAERTEPAPSAPSGARGRAGKTAAQREAKRGRAGARSKAAAAAEGRAAEDAAEEALADTSAPQEALADASAPAQHSDPAHHGAAPKRKRKAAPARKDAAEPAEAEAVALDESAGDEASEQALEPSSEQASDHPSEQASDHPSDQAIDHSVDDQGFPSAAARLAEDSRAADVEGLRDAVAHAGEEEAGAADGIERGDGAESPDGADPDSAEGEEDAGLAAALPTSANQLSEAQLAALLEALIFASDKPLTVQRLRQLTRVSDSARLTRALELLATQYQGRGIALSVVSGGYQLRTESSYSAWVQQLIAGRPVRLSRAQLETLAIIAYRQPITRPEIDEIRGVDSTGTLKVLMDRNLVRILGKREEVGRPMLYGTTKEFLDFFSLNDLRELPTLREYSELSPESREVVAKMGFDTPGAAAATDETTDEATAAASDQAPEAAARVPASAEPAPLEPVSPFLDDGDSYVSTRWHDDPAAEDGADEGLEEDDLEAAPGTGPGHDPRDATEQIPMAPDDGAHWDDAPADAPADESTDEFTDEFTDELADELTDEPADEPSAEGTDEATDEVTDEATDEVTDELPTMPIPREVERSPIDDLPAQDLDAGGHAWDEAPEPGPLEEHDGATSDAEPNDRGDRAQPGNPGASASEREEGEGEGDTLASGADGSGAELDASSDELSDPGDARDGQVAGAESFDAGEPTDEVAETLAALATERAPAPWSDELAEPIFDELAPEARDELAEPIFDELAPDAQHEPAARDDAAASEDGRADGPDPLDAGYGQTYSHAGDEADALADSGEPLAAAQPDESEPAAPELEDEPPFHDRPEDE